MAARELIEAKIAQLEADFAQDDIIDAEDIKPAVVPEAKPVVVTKMRPGMSVMVKEPKPARCYAMLVKELASGRTGLCVMRSSPREIREDYDVGRTRVIWLTSNEKMDMSLPPSALGFSSKPGDQSGADDEYVQPNGLPALFAMMLAFMDGNPGGIILLEGLEYLTSHNSFQSVLNFLQKVSENVKRTGSNMIISVNPAAFDAKQFSQLETEMSQVL
jgi:hypothetical protein